MEEKRKSSLRREKVKWAGRGRPALPGDFNHPVAADEGLQDGWVEALPEFAEGGIGVLDDLLEAGDLAAGLVDVEQAGGHVAIGADSRREADVFGANIRRKRVTGGAGGQGFLEDAPRLGKEGGPGGAAGVEFVGPVVAGRVLGGDDVADRIQIDGLQLRVEDREVIEDHQAGDRGGGGLIDRMVEVDDGRGEVGEGQGVGAEAAGVFRGPMRIVGDRRRNPAESADARAELESLEAGEGREMHRADSRRAVGAEAFFGEPVALAERMPEDLLADAVRGRGQVGDEFAAGRECPDAAAVVEDGAPVLWQRAPTVEKRPQGGVLGAQSGSGGGGGLGAVVDDEDVRRVQLEMPDDVRHQPRDDAGIDVEEVEHRAKGRADPARSAHLSAAWRGGWGATEKRNSSLRRKKVKWAGRGRPALPWVGSGGSRDPVVRRMAGRLGSDREEEE